MECAEMCSSAYLLVAVHLSINACAINVVMNSLKVFDFGQ